MAFDISYVYQIIDKYTRPIRGIERATNAARRTIHKTSLALDTMGNRLGNLNSAISGFVGFQAIKFPIQESLKFEDKLLDVQKVLNLKPGEGLNQIREMIFESSKAVGGIPTGIAEIVTQGGKVAIANKEMKKFLDIVSMTSVAFDTQEGVAAKSIGSIKTKMALSISATKLLMDAVNKLADNTSASGANMIEIIERTSASFKDMNIPTEMIAGWAAFADQVQVSPELAASGLRMMIQKFKVLPRFAKEMEQKGPTEVIVKFLEKIKKLPKHLQALRLKKFFGEEAGRFAAAAANDLNLLGKTMDIVRNKGNFVGSMAKELAIKLGGAGMAVKKVRTAFLISMIEIGDVMKPTLKSISKFAVGVIEKFTKFVKLHPGLVKIGAALVAITAIVSSATLFIGIMATALSAIISIPGAIVVGLIAISTFLSIVYARSKEVRIAFSEMAEPLKEIFNTINAALFKFEGMSDFMDTMESVAVHILKIFKSWFTVVKYVIDYIIWGFNLLSKIPKLFSPSEMGKRLERGTKDVFTPRTHPGLIQGYEERESARAAKIRAELSGAIRITAAQGLDASGDMETNMPGDLGFNFGF